MTDKMRESEMNPYYRERKRELNHQLYERVQSELAVFYKEMLGRTPDEIAAAFSSTDYSPASVRALLKSPNLLDDIYKEWQEHGSLPPGGLKELIEEFRKYMVKTEQILSGQER